MDFMQMYQQMTWVAKAVAFVLLIMSMWSLGVAIERILHVHAGAQPVEALCSAGGQAPQGRPSEGRHRALLLEELSLQPSGEGRARGTAGISVPAGKRRRSCSREDLMDTVRRVDSARVGADRVGPQEGRFGARHHRLDGPVRRTARHGRRRHQRVPGHRRGWLGRHRRRLGRYFGSARRDRARSGRRDSGGVVLQLPHRPHRVLQRGDGQLLVGARRLLHQEDGVTQNQTGSAFRVLGSAVVLEPTLNLEP